MTNNKILIIGGLGFIGFHLAKRLANQFEVFVIDALINYIPNNYNTWQYYVKYRQKILKDLNVTFYIEDVQQASFKSLLTTLRPDIVINAASMPVALLADINPKHAKNDIFDAHFNVLESIRTSSITLERYVYLSSSMVYGNFFRDEQGNILPASENQECLPIDTYGAFKLANEILVKQYGFRYKIPYVIIRPSAVYGPTDCNLRVTEIFLHQGFQEGTIKLDNGGQHKLDFTYIDDLVDGIMAALISPNALNQVFNISYGVGRKISELAQIVKNLFPSVKIVTNDCIPFRPNRGAMNIDKAKQLLSYNPSFSLEKGMQQYCEFVKQHIKNYSL